MHWQDLRRLLLHTLPHELRTPLVGILGGAELLRLDEEASDPAHDVAYRPDNAGDNLWSGQF